MKFKHLHLLVVFTFSAFFLNAQIYVNSNILGGANDGSSWMNAYQDLSTALNNASDGDEIWVAYGTYSPTSGTDRSISFVIPHGVSIYGGFLGLPNETNLSDRDWQNNITILSGDIGTSNDPTDNSYQVVNIPQTTTAATLDGFTITLGYANGAFTKDGAGIYQNAYTKSHSAAAVIKNCTFTKNYAENSGGAIYIEAGAGGSAAPVLENCLFDDNSAGSSGGAIFLSAYNAGNVQGTFTTCTFNSNEAAMSGGAVYINASFAGTGTPLFTRCDFDSNTAAAGSGGAIYNQGNIANGNASPSILNSRFYNNNAFSGGAIYNNGSSVGNSSPSIINCTFSGNFTNAAGGTGGAIYCNGETAGNSSPIITNCIIWGNTGPWSSHVIRSVYASPTISYSVVDAADCTALQSGVNPNVTCGAGMIFNIDPLFNNQAIGDLTLQSGSPAIDAGDNSANSEAFDFAGNNRKSNGVIDIGAYELTLLLPVELVTFRAVLNQENEVELSWITASETNNDYFTLLHSTDGINFSELDKIHGAGDSDVQLYYSSMHQNPTIGMNYYRLMQTDFDGTYTMSNIETVAVHGDDLSIFPNPASDNLNILFPNTSSKKYSIVIFDILGKEVFNGSIEPGSDVHSISLAQAGILSKGTYFIRIFDSKFDVFTQKFQKH